MCQMTSFTMFSPEVGRWELRGRSGAQHNTTPSSNYFCKRSNQEFDALCALKSALHAYATLDEMADDRCEGLLRDRTHAQLDALMAHQESRIFHDAGQLDWNPRVLLMNDGGAADVNAHLAAGLSRSRHWSGSRGRCSMTPIDVRRAHSTPDDPRRQKGAGAGRTPASGAGIPHRSSLAGPRPRACARKRRSPTIALSL